MESNKEQLMPYTKNTKEIRYFLEQRGFSPLRFYQGGEYVYPSVTTWANSKGTWKDGSYATFSADKIKSMSFLDSEPSSELDFKKQVILLQAQ